jgi:tetratricopeptide (TPR) repeat protein
LVHRIPSRLITIEALIAFSWHRCDTQPDLEIANHAVKAAKASTVKTYIASAVWCLGWTYRQLGDDRSSYNHLQEAYLLSSDPSPGDMELQRLHLKCGIDLVEVARVTLEDKGKVVSLARDVESKCATISDDHIHGRSLGRLGSALHAAGQTQEAMEHLNRARVMLKAVKNIPYLAGVYEVIAGVHYYEWRLPEALEAIQEAWKLVESIDALKHNISLTSALIHFTANRDTEAWKLAEIALMKASHLGDRLTIASTLELMGYGYLRRGDYENAYGAYEAAAQKFPGTVSANLEQVCEDNMARIKRKQRNPDANVGFYRSTLDVDRSLFYPVIRASASDDKPHS